MTTSRIGPNPPSAAPPPDRVIQVGPERRLEALGRLVARGTGPDPDHATRFLKFATEHGVSLDELWAMLDDCGRISHAALGVPGPGRCAMLFASRAAGNRDVPSCGRVIDQVCRRLAERDIHLAQALLEVGERLEHNAFQSGGFHDLARLSYMEAPLGGGVAPPVWPPDVAIEQWSGSHDELIDVLDQSYEGTLDCPGLVGLRQTNDILDGHRGTGHFDPSLWTVMRVADRAAGALLMNPGAGGEAIELVYLGLAPWARGRGLATALLRYGLRLLAGRRERIITLAVDERNLPAIALYRRAGFRRAMRRIAVVRSLRELPHR